MGEQIRVFIRGIGSVLDIAPANDYSEFIPKETTMERLGQSFEKVGNDIRTAMKKIDEKANASQ